MYNGVGYKVDYKDLYKKVQVFGIEAVPIQIRYNWRSWIGTGAGLLVAGELSRKTSDYEEAALIQANGQSGMIITGEKNSRTESFSEWRGALFADLQLGMVRAGPALGLRFLHYVNPSQQRLYFFATWRL
jgi:hypothetical protein